MSASRQGGGAPAPAALVTLEKLLSVAIFALVLFQMYQ